MEEASRRLFDFNSPEELARWQVVKGSARGGAPECAFSLSAESVATFQGTAPSGRRGVSLSVRTFPQRFGLAGYDGLRVLARGDGASYRVTLSIEGGPAGVVYEHAFATKPRTWIAVVVPFGRCVPRPGGATEPPKGGLAGEAIRKIGFAVAEGHTGPFRLDVDWIDAYAALESGSV